MEYTISEKTYIQKKLVPGQVEQLIELLQDLTFPGGFDIGGIIASLGDRLWKGVAIVLREKGVDRWWEKDLDAIAETIHWEMPAEQAVQVIRDFFDCNPVISLFEQLAGMNTSLKKQILQMVETNAETGSPGPSSSSATETSQKQSTSDGA